MFSCDHVDAAGLERIGQRVLKPLTFWPVRTGWGEPDALQYRAGKIEYCRDRIASDPWLSKLLGSATEVTRDLCKIDFILEMNSYFAVQKDHSPKTVSIATSKYPDTNFDYWSSFVAFGLDNIADLAAIIMRDIKVRHAHLLEQLLFDRTIAATVINEGESVFAGMLSDIEAEKIALDFERRRFYFGTDWPAEVRSVMEQVKVKRAATNRAK